MLFSFDLDSLWEVRVHTSVPQPRHFPLPPSSSPQTGLFFSFLVSKQASTQGLNWSEVIQVTICDMSHFFCMKKIPVYITQSTDIIDLHLTNGVYI